MTRKFVLIEDLIGDQHYADLPSGSIKIRPLGVGEIAGMVLMWPEIGAILRGDPVHPETLSAIARGMPEAVPYILSLSLGLGGLPGVPAVCRLSATDQMTILSATLKITFPDGTGPFFKLVDELLPPVAPAKTGTPDQKPAHPDQVDLADLQQP